MNHPSNDNPSSPITGGIIDNCMHNSSTTLSWEVLRTDANYPDIDVLRQLEQSMQFQNQDDDDWSQDEDNDEEEDCKNEPSMRHKSKSTSQPPEIVSSVHTLWKGRFLYLIGINVLLVVATTVVNVVLHVTPDNKTLSLIPVILNSVQLLIMVLLYYVFRIYNIHVQQANAEMIQKSTKALHFVAQMFPEKLREQLFNHDNNNAQSESKIGSSNHQSHISLTTAVDNVVDSNKYSSNDSSTDIERGRVLRTSSAIRGSLDNTTTATTSETTNNNNGASCRSGMVLHDDYKPIAELYPETTVMLLDLAGFTAWSAVHEPCEVFLLLETIFYEFDVLASKRNIFKVETVGDCYVAVAGIPEPRPDHGVVMARFARECMMRFQSIVQQLEVRFGHGTSQLGMRIGLNSGPITGGILRGERSRFQLFGDTINTAARMESNSCKGRIQVSETTAQLLFNANKHHWLIKREDEIEAKGKGTLQTYWLDINANHGSMIGSAIGDNIHKPVVTEDLLEEEI